MQLYNRGMRGCVAIQRDLLGGAPLLDGLLQGPRGRSNIAACTHEKVDRLPLCIHSAIEVTPLASDLNIRLVDTPRTPYRPGVPLPVLLTLRDLALDPPHDGRMRQVDTSLGHHCSQVSVAQFIREILSDTQKHELLITVTAFKQSC